MMLLSFKKQNENFETSAKNGGEKATDRPFPLS
jgi:hypothetical protein